jgi:streptogramin lyase
MIDGRTGRTRLVAVVATVAIGFGAAGAAAAAPASATTKGGSAEPLVWSKPSGPLSARLTALAAAATRGTANSANAQNSAVGLPATGAGSLLHSRDGRLIVEVRTADTSKATIARLRAVGTVINVANQWRTTTIAIAPNRLTALARIHGVQSAMESVAPVTNAVAAGSASPATVTSNNGRCGSVRSEAYTVEHADQAQNHDFVDGTGQTVGILSDSFGDDSANVASGDLPGPGNPCGRYTPVKVLQDESGSNEGRAMAQLVHDVAPGAALDFATADDGMTAFASNIAALKAAGASTIVDDVTYFAEPFFQDGPIAVAANAATSDGKTNYFSAAGNDNVIVGGQNVGSYEAAKFRPTPCPAAVIAFSGEKKCHDFDPSPGVSNGDTITIAPESELDINFQYAEPWYGVTDDFDVFLVDTTTGEVVGDSADDNLTTQQPSELAFAFNASDSPENVEVVIGRHSGQGRPRIKFSIIGSEGIDAVQFSTSSGPDVIGPTIYGHNGAASVTSMAAAPAADTTTPETYSSRGPVTMVYGPVDGTTPASPLPRVERLLKPDLTAADCVSTSMVQFSTFCGTSAAAPDAAAVAALMKQRNPRASAKLVVNKMKATATPMANGSPQSTGAGFVNAAAAVSAVGGPPQYAKFTAAGVNAPLSITTGPDGALWFGEYSGAIGRITPTGAITLFSDARVSYADSITTGPDGNIWFTNKLTNQIGRLTPSGVFTFFTDPSLSGPTAITVGPDDALWFLNETYPNYSVGRIAVDGTIAHYTDPSINQPQHITAGPDGALWFTNLGGAGPTWVGSIGRITTAGVVTSYSGSNLGYEPDGIAVGPDGNLWYTQLDSFVGNRIGRIQTDGTLLPYYYDPSIQHADDITTGPDAALWFTDEGNPDVSGDESIGRITADGVVTKFTDPSIERTFGIVTGPDGNVWTANFDSNSIGRFTAGFRQVSVVTDPTIDAPSAIANGPGGALWFTNGGGNSIGRVSIAGAVTNFTDPAIDSPSSIVEGRDKAMWFTNRASQSIGRITGKGAVTSFSAPDIGNPSSITAGPDGALWFTTGGDGVGRITTAGVITMFHDARISDSFFITAGPDGALWFTDLGPVANGDGTIDRITTDGVLSVFTDPSFHTPGRITAGPDGALWFTDSGRSSIGRITTDGTVTTLPAPGWFQPTVITTGPDGALWVSIASGLGRMITTGSFTSIPAVGYAETPIQAAGLTTGPDNELWFTGFDNVIGHVSLVDHS